MHHIFHQMTNNLMKSLASVYTIYHYNSTCAGLVRTLSYFKLCFSSTYFTSDSTFSMLQANGTKPHNSVIERMSFETVGHVFVYVCVDCPNEVALKNSKRKSFIKDTNSKPNPFYTGLTLIQTKHPNINLFPHHISKGAFCFIVFRKEAK